MTAQRFTGSRVLVTAAASGIGLTVARRFASEGARVQCATSTTEGSRRCAPPSPQISMSHADVASAADVTKLFEEVRESLGGLDVLVSNAGIAGPVGPVQGSIPTDGGGRSTSISPGRSCALAPRFPCCSKRQGGRSSLMSSNAGLMGLPFRAPYVASKWALIGLVKTLAMELGVDQIRVNAICPGDVEGARIERVIAAEADARGLSVAEIVAERVAAVSLRTMVTADDVAALILFLCSEEGAQDLRTGPRRRRQCRTSVTVSGGGTPPPSNERGLRWTS